MIRAVHVACALAATLSACFAPPPAPEPEVQSQAPAPPALAAPTVPSPPAEAGPGYVVTVLVGGEPKSAASQELSGLGSDSLDYLGTCVDSDHRTNDTLQWDAANGAPLCVRLIFVPPAKLPTGVGAPVEAAEILVPLGMPQLDGFVLVRSSAGPRDGFLGGDPALLARIKQRAAGVLAVTPTAR